MFIFNFFRRHKKTLLILVFFVISIINGCSTLSFNQTDTNRQPFDQSDWINMRANMQKLKKWCIEGRASINFYGKNYTINYQWSQNSNDYELLVSSNLLSQTLLNIKATPNRSQIYIIGKGILQTQKPETYLKQLLGISIPILSISYWLKTLPNPNYSNHLQYDQSSKPLLLTQQNWFIHFKKFALEKDHTLTPKMIILNSKLEPVTITIFIKNWKFETLCS